MPTCCHRLRRHRSTPAANWCGAVGCLPICLNASRDPDLLFLQSGRQGATLAIVRNGRRSRPKGLMAPAAAALSSLPAAWARAVSANGTACGAEAALPPNSMPIDRIIRSAGIEDVRWWGMSRRYLTLPTALVIGLAIIVIAEGIVYWMGHPIFCKCGTIKFWYGLKSGPEQSQQFTDWYTYSHILHGIILYWLLAIVARGRLSVAARFVIAALIEGAWEVFENTPFII